MLVTTPSESPSWAGLAAAIIDVAKRHAVSRRDSFIMFNVYVSHRVCFRSAKLKQVWFCSRLIAAFNFSFFIFYFSFRPQAASVS
jgi:hypothetical protein